MTFRLTIKAIPVLLFFVIFFCIGQLSAQVFKKRYTIAGQALRAQSTCKLADGKLVLAGTRSPTTIDQGIFLLKLDPGTGDTIWSKSFTSTGHYFNGVCVDELSGGNLVVVANRGDSLVAGSPATTFIMELSAAGNINWSKKYAYPGPKRFRAPMVRHLTNNNFVVCNTNEDSSGISIVKMNIAGDTLWSRSLFVDSTITQGDYLVTDILPVSDGIVFSGLVGYDGDNENMLLFKTDTLGHVLWLRSEYPYPAGGPDGGLYTISTNLLQTPDSNIAVGINMGILGIMKMDRNGHPLWFRVLNDTVAYYTPPQYGAFSLTNNGGFLFTGATDLTNITGTYYHVGKQYIVKTDSAAQIQWSKKYKFEKNLNDCNFICQLPDGQIFCTGTLYDTTVISSLGRSRAYSMRLDSSGVSSGAICSEDTAYSPFISSQLLGLFNRTHHQLGGYGYDTALINPQGTLVSVDSVPLLAAVSISCSGSTICQGDHVVFFGNFSNGGTSPTFNFLVNGTSVQFGSSSSLNTTTLAYPDTVTCVMVSNAACVSPDTVVSNFIVPLIYPTVPPIVSIMASPTGPILPGTPVTFTVTFSGAGPSPYIYWQKNGATVFTSSLSFTTSTLVNGDVITCKVASSSSFCFPNPNTISNAISIPVDDGVAIVGTPARFSISPNPATSFFTINLSPNLEAGYQIKDLSGREVLQGMITERAQQVDISRLAAGLYLAELQCNGQREVLKLVVVR